MKLELRDRWAATWSLTSIQRDRASEAETFDALAAAYSESHRSYHTLQHLQECFTVLDSLAEVQRYEVEFALWFHDVVHDPRVHDGSNEDESSVWAFRALKSLSFDDRREIRRLILLTAHAASPLFTEDSAGAVVLDVDLAILGAPSERFDEYEAQIRREYEHVPEQLFRAARAARLESFLGRRSVFSSPVLAARLEAPARSNLERSLLALRSLPEGSVCPDAVVSSKNVP